MIDRKIDVQVKLTPAEIASEFCEMHSDDQAMFLNKVAELSKEWPNPFCFQLQSITNEDLLTDEARYIMHQIGEYSEKHQS